jgi:hypothetical protein
MHPLRLSAVFAGLVVAAACQATPVKPPTEESPYRATSTVREIMQSVVEPSAQGLWDSVGTISNEKGTFNLEPRTDAEWAAVRRHAVTLLESTNLLVIPGRHIAQNGAVTSKADDADPGSELHPAEIEKRMLENWPVWVGMAHALHDSAQTMLRTIDKKDVTGLESTGSDLDGVCESCHRVFWYPPRAASAK